MDAVLTAKGSLFPSRVMETALRGRTDEGSEVIKSGYVANREITRAPVVAASKSRKSFRPVHILGVYERVLYEAMVRAFDPPLPTPDRGDEAFEAFQTGPLDGAAGSHVLLGDVSSYYQYIDHRTLEAELVARTGIADLAMGLRELLSGLTGRTFGLPQTNSTSHVLGDIYIDRAERRLLRLGYELWRYNDDFGVSIPATAGIRTFFLRFEEVLREIGLTPNDDKSLVFTRAKYQEWVDRPGELKRQTSQSVAFDFDAWMVDLPSEYADVVDTPAEDGAADIPDGDPAIAESRVAGSVKVLELWAEHLSVAADESDPLELAVLRRLARDAITVLRKQGATEGLGYCELLMNWEPQLTNSVGMYLSRLSRLGHGEAGELASRMLQRPEVELTSWQVLWLLDPQVHSAEIGPDLVGHVETLAASALVHDLVRARAGLVLASHRQTTPQKLGLLYDALDPPARPDVVAAVATLAQSVTDPHLTSLVRDDPLYPFIATAYAGSNATG